MKRMLALLIFYGASAGAQPLSLATNLEQVKTQNPQARSLVDGVQIAELRLEEADVPLSSQLYAEYNLADSKDEPYTPVSPPRVKEKVRTPGASTAGLMAVLRAVAKLRT